MKKTAVLIVGVVAAMSVAGASDEGLFAFVNKVEDGDTVQLTVTNAEKTVRCRLAGIDAPERGQSFFSVAHARLTELVEKKNVRFVDVGDDKYRRKLGRIYLEDGQDVNLEMVREGYAWHLSHFLTNEVYKAAQKEAKEAKRGLWIEKNPTEPRTYRTPRRANARK